MQPYDASVSDHQRRAFEEHISPFSENQLKAVFHMQSVFPVSSVVQRSQSCLCHCPCGLCMKRLDGYYK